MQRKVEGTLFMKKKINPSQLAIESFFTITSE